MGGGGKLCPPPSLDLNGPLALSLPLSPLQVELISIADCMLLAHLLRGHVEGDRPEVHLFVRVNARHDEEEAGALGAAGSQPP